MNELYRGCDILELVGRGKKSTALAASRGNHLSVTSIILTLVILTYDTPFHFHDHLAEIASYFAEAIDARVNEVDDSMTNQQLDNQDT